MLELVSELWILKLKPLES